MRYDAAGMRVKRKPFLLIAWIMLLVTSVVMGITAIVMLVAPLARISALLPSGNCLAVAVVSAKPGDGLTMALPAGNPVICRDADSTVSASLPNSHTFTARATGVGAGLVPGDEVAATFPFTPRYVDTDPTSGGSPQLSTQITVREPVVLSDVPVDDVVAAASVSLWPLAWLVLASLLGVASFIVFVVWLITGITVWWRTPRAR